MIALCRQVIFGLGRRRRAVPLGAGRWQWRLCALVRGSYVMFVEKAGAPPIRVDLAPRRLARRHGLAASQPVGVHVLADPGHAWRYGSSVRIAAGRDVFLEEVKDAAIGMYSRDVAMRVLTRTRAIDDFTALTPSRARALAREYDIALSRHRNHAAPAARLRQCRKFRIYRLR